MKAKLTALLAGFLLILGLQAYTVAAAPSITIQCADPSGLPTTSCDVLLDPDIHGGSKGTVLYHATSAVKATVTYPTGPHKLAIVGAAKGSTGTNTSVLVVSTDPGSACKSGWAPVGYQSWWSDTGQDPVFGSRHAHIDNLCIPANNKIVTGKQTFTFNVQTHKQPVGATLMRVRVWSSSGGDRWVCTPSRRDAGCPSSWPAIVNGALVTPFSATIDFAPLATGRLELRFGVYVKQPNGFIQLLSSRTEVCNRACSPSFRSGNYQGNGSWYRNDSIGYEDVRTYSPFAVSP